VGGAGLGWAVGAEEMSGGGTVGSPWVGMGVGRGVGLGVGRAVGVGVGSCVGNGVGFGVGLRVGSGVRGASVGGALGYSW